MPLTRRIQVFIGEEASWALDTLMKRTGERQTALIERLLMEAAGEPRKFGGLNPPVIVGPLPPLPEGATHWTVNGRSVPNEPDPEDVQRAVVKRAEKKAARKERKTELQSSVSEALPPSGVNPDRIVAQQSYCPRHRPKYCAPDCPHRVNV